MFSQQSEKMLKMLNLYSSTESTLRLVLLGVEKSERTQSMRQAVKKYSDSIHLEVVDYAQALKQPEVFLKALRANCWVKIDSPHDDPQLQNAFIKRGWTLQQHTERPLVLPQTFDELPASDDWYMGYAEFLQSIETNIPINLKVNWLNSVKAVLLMVDNWRTQQHFQTNNLPVPNTLGRIRSYDELKALMQSSKKHPQVIIKQRYHTPTSTTISFRSNAEGKKVATSTLAVKEGRLYVGKKLNKYTDEVEIAQLINALTQYDAYIEQYLVKPQIVLNEKELAFDFRILSVGGAPQHKIVRSSKPPIASPHLDNGYIDPALVKKKCDTSYMYDILEEAASKFKTTHSIAFDIICTSEKAWLIGAHVFNDFFPEQLFNGQSSHEVQVAYILKQAAPLNGGYKPPPALVK